MFALEDGLSVAAFVENPEDEKSTIAGLNVLYRGGKERDLEFQKFTVRSKSEFFKRKFSNISIIFSE